MNCGFDSKTSSRDLAETLIKCGYWNINTLLDDINKLLESRKNGHDVLSRVKPHDSVELTAYNVGIIASQSLIRNYMDELKEVAKNKN